MQRKEKEALRGLDYMTEVKIKVHDKPDYSNESIPKKLNRYYVSFMEFITPLKNEMKIIKGSQSKAI